MITTAALLLLTPPKAQLPQVTVPHAIKQEIARVIRLSNNGNLPGFWPDLTEEDWNARRPDEKTLDLMVGGWIRVRYDLEAGRIVFFTNPLRGVVRGTPPESREAMLARAARFDREMGLPRYDYVEEWVPSMKGLRPDGSTPPLRLRLTRRWPGNPVPYGLGSESGMVIEPENHNIRIWSNGIYSPPPIGPPPAFLPGETLRLQASVACLNLHPNLIASAGREEITLSAVRRLRIGRENPLKPDASYWSRPLTPTQLYAKQQGLSVYVAQVRVGLTDESGRAGFAGTVSLDPATGQIDEVYISRMHWRGEAPVRRAAPPTPAQSAWLSRDGVRSQVRLTEASSSEKPRGLPVGVLMAKDTARRVEIDSRAKVLWFQSTTGWQSMGWAQVDSR